MSYWIGLFFIVSGVLSLVFNELTVQVRRVWPWRRDDSNAERDAERWHPHWYGCRRRLLLSATGTLTGMAVAAACC